MNRLLLVTLILFSGNLYGQTLITDRPDQTESSSTVEFGSLQVESGFLLGFTDEGFNSIRQILLPSTLFRYGLTNAIELRILSQFESLKNNSQIYEGISDLEIGAKVQLFKKENVNTEIAFLSHLILPTGTNELSGDKFGTINKLAVSHEINEQMGFGYNVGYNYLGNGNGDLTYSMAIGIAINDKVGVYLETYGDIVEFQELLVNFDTGLTYLVKDNLQLDFSFGTGINHTMNYISLGFSWKTLKKESRNY
jgi:hypothetical protein